MHPSAVIPQDRGDYINFFADKCFSNLFLLTTNNRNFMASPGNLL